MAIIVEDGSIVANANCYVSEAEYEAWSEARYGVRDDLNAEAELLKAMDVFEAMKFRGYRVSASQALSFPRYGFYIDGDIQESDSIPALVKTVVMELAWMSESGTLNSGCIKRVKLENIEEEYSSPSSISNISKSLSRLLGPLSVVRA